MKSRSLFYKAINEDPEGGIYDEVPTEEEDLWFLPGPGEEEDIPPGAPPLPRANQTSLVDLKSWQNAEGALAKPLAQLSARLGALDERLRCAPEGWRHRLALIEASELSWLGTRRISVERLALWQSLRLNNALEDTQSLARSGWALRRLSGGVATLKSSVDEIAAFLDRKDPEGLAEAEAGGQVGETFWDQLTSWCTEMQQAQDLHPITRACFGFHLWELVGLLDRLPGADMEAAVLAARLATSDLPGGSLFLPLSGGGVSGLRRGGSPVDRLRHFVEGAAAATLAALRHLEQLENWQRRADRSLAHKSGRTPKQLVTLLASWPQVSAPMAEAEVGASRAAIQRNLNDMHQLGLIREITGQGRYRVWSAQL